MNREELYQHFIPKDRDLKEIAASVISSPDLILALLEGVYKSSARIKFGSLNTLVILSKKAPRLLYSHFDTFVTYLESENKFFRLGGITMLANLTQVDKARKFENIFERYYAFITDSGMTAAANVCKGSVTIGKSKPHLIHDIAHHLLKVEMQTYKTRECKNILLGHVITTFDKLFDELEDKETILQFVERQSKNEWQPTMKKAVNFLTKYQRT